VWIVTIPHKKFAILFPVNHIELRDLILGGQDGLVNVLGITLGLFAAGATTHIIIIAGLAAGFSESVSMGAVAYTSASVDTHRLKTESLSQFAFDALVVGLSALVCSLIPLIPFAFLSTTASVVTGIILSSIILFAFGVFRARSVGGSLWKSGFQILVIGLVSAFAGFLIGLVLKA
jgi:VIT1/CCC1 family predicted Fe2+/Mn2+ transporter